LNPSGQDQHQQSSHLGTQLQQQQQQQQQIQLPIGVGIRLGGIGGIAVPVQQSQQQQQQQQSGVVPGAQFGAVNHHIWGVPVINNVIEGGMPDKNNDGGSGEQQIAQRRQRNREHAKRSRVRKKFMLESLQEQVRGLQNENSRLRLLVQEHIPEHAMQIIGDCCSKNHLFENFTNMKAEDSSAEKTAADPVKGELVRSDYSLMQSLMAGQRCFVLSDPTLPDNPIVFATPDFYKLTGYTSKEVLGRNCRFLQGPGTDKQTVDVIRRAIATGSDATVCLLNYKCDGTPFWNQFFIGALRDADNNIVNYVSGLVWLLRCFGIVLDALHALLGSFGSHLSC
jgi:PAS domain S-box-containing protein